jgi:hypothetical protein
MFAASSWPGSVLAAQGFAGDAAVGEVEDQRIGPIGRIGPITQERATCSSCLSNSRGSSSPGAQVSVEVLPEI